jgi:integrase
MCNRIAKRACLDPKLWNLHKFRRSFATTNLMAGIAVSQVRDWLGHRDLKSIESYLATIDARSEHAQAMISKMAAYAGVASWGVRG